MLYYIVFPSKKMSSQKFLRGLIALVLIVLSQLSTGQDLKNKELQDAQELLRKVIKGAQSSGIELKEQIEKTNQIIRIAEKHNADTLLTCGLAHKGIMCFLSDSLNEARKILFSLKEVEINKLHYFTRFLTNMYKARVLAADYKYKEAIEVLNKAYEIAKTVDSKNWMATCTLLTGQWAGMFGNDKLTIEKYKEAYSIYMQNKTPNLAGYALVNLANVFGVKGQLDSALAYSLKGKNLMDPKRDKEALLTTEINIAGIYYDMGKIKEGDIQLAQIKSVLDTLNLKHIENLYQEYLCKSMVAKKNWRAAAKAMEKLIARSDESRSREWLLSRLGSLISYYDSAADYNSAFRISKQLGTLKDSIYTSEKNKALAEIIAKTDVERHKLENALLKAELDSQDFKNYLLAAIALLFISVGAISTLSFRNKKLKAEKLFKKAKQEVVQENLQRMEIEKEAKILAKSLAMEQAEKEELQTEVQEKSEQIIQLATQNTHKKELVKQLEILSYSYNNTDRRLANLINDLKQEIINNPDQELIEETFLKANPNFNEKLREQFPQLTENDLRILGFIKQGFDSKQIALLINVKEESLHNTRSRIRKKVGLQINESLEDWLASLNFS